MWPWVTGTVVADDAVVEHGDGASRGAVDRRRNGNVDCPHQGAGVRHVAVQRHDVQVIGVSGENVVDQVRHPRKGPFRVDGRLSTERGITGGGDVRGGRSIDADGWERTAVLRDAYPPGIQEHSRKVTGVVDMKVTEEDGLQPCEVETGLDECRGGASPAIDHEDVPLDDEGRGDPRPSGHRHRCPGRPEEDQLSRHGDPTVSLPFLQSLRILVWAGYCWGWA